MEMREQANNALKEIVHYMDNLSNITRCPTWDRLRGMNVAEHTFRVTVLAMALADMYNVNAEEKVDVGLLLRLCLLHDFEEAINGDIAYPVKNRDMATKAFFSEVEHETIEKMFVHMKAYRDYAHGGTGIYHDILKLADMMELLTYACREVRMGNEYMVVLARRCIDYMYKILDSHENLGGLVYEYMSNLSTWIRERSPYDNYLEETYGLQS